MKILNLLWPKRDRIEPNPTQKCWGRYQIIMAGKASKASTDVDCILYVMVALNLP